MRKPHQHEAHGQRFDCADPECKKPFRILSTPNEILARPENAGNRRFYRQRVRREKVASREVQHARYLDCGPLNWDDRDPIGDE